jgi:hypothetical protein
MPSVHSAGPTCRTPCYKLQLVPHQRPSEADAYEVATNTAPPPGWELVTSRLTNEGDELRVLREVDPTLVAKARN